MEEISIAHDLMVTWIREFIEDEGGWHTWISRGQARTGGDKHLPPGDDLELVVSQSHRQDGSKFSMHVVSPSIMFDKSTLGLKSFVCDLAVYIVYRMFKELGNHRCMVNLLPDRLNAKDRAVLRMMKLHPYGRVTECNNICRVGRVTPLDCVVYKTRGQLFRLVGMGKVKRGVLGDKLVLCRGDGRNAWDLEECGIGNRVKWMNSIVSHCSLSANFLRPIHTWRSWVYLPKDFEWGREQGKYDMVEDGDSSSAPIDNVCSERGFCSMMRSHHRGPTPAFMWDKLTGRNGVVGPGCAGA